MDDDIKRRLFRQYKRDLASLRMFCMFSKRVLDYRKLEIIRMTMPDGKVHEFPVDAKFWHEKGCKMEPKPGVTVEVLTQETF